MKLVLISFILLFPLQILAQQTDSIALKVIPYNLFWERQPSTYTISGDSISIEAKGGTDMYRDSYGSYLPNNAPRLLFRADINFILTVDVRQAFADEWNAGGIVLEGDSTHWVKFNFERDNTGARRIVSVVTNGYSDDCNSTALQNNHAYLKLAKAGDVIIMYYSIDGHSWYMVRRLRFAFPGPVLAGLIVQAPGSNGNTVHFSHISYQLKKVDNPFGIEKY